MKGERAAMTALCMVMRSPATSNAKSHQGASSRLHSKRTLWDCLPLPQQHMKAKGLPFLLCINFGPCFSAKASHRGWMVRLAATMFASSRVQGAKGQHGQLTVRCCWVPPGHRRAWTACAARPPGVPAAAASARTASGEPCRCTLKAHDSPEQPYINS